MDLYTVRRRTIKGQLTRLETVMTNHAVTPLTSVAVATYKVKIDALAIELDSVQQYISTSCPLADFNVHETEYNALVARMEILVIFFSTLSIQAPAIPTSFPTADIKLPKLELPVFGGNYIDWFPFHDLFTATVHNNGALSSAQKFQYLKTSLRGEAALLIHSIPVTDGNYTEAWDILLNRFNNTREIVSAHIKRLLNQSPVRDESAIALRRLIDITAECIRSLKVLKEPVQHWDAILIYVIGEKLDNESRRQWELSLKGTTRPTYEELTEFLEQRARALAASQSTSREHRSKQVSSAFPKRNPVSHYGSVRDNICAICSESHPTFKCPGLLKATHEARWNLVKSNSLCFNCLKKDHVSSECKAGNCKKCTAKHNTLLHQEPYEKESTSRVNSSNEVVSHVSRQLIGPAQVILPTAIIQVRGFNGYIWSVRALIDSGSQVNFITEQFMQKLQVRRNYQTTTIGGIGASKISQSRGGATLTISSSVNNAFKTTIEVLILKQVTERLPNVAVNIQNWPHIKKLRLADPTFNIPGSIDLLLGADVFLTLIQDGKLMGRPGVPGAFNTVFGWVVAGTTGGKDRTTPPIHVHHSQLETQLAKFWEMEEIANRPNLTPTEIQCEKSFEETVTRDDTGRYIVKLPIKDKAEKLGESRSIAVRRFKYVERRLEANPTIYEKYRSFMEEYLKLNHMEPVPAGHRNQNNTYYLPHHAVFKDSSSTTKLRVVFDGSSKTSNGISLNDILLVGPKLQSDLINLLIRFRSHAVALMADIEKMYRQILIHEEDRHYQRIIWRRQKEDPIEDYQLRTVTYGTASAPYLATRVLQQLSKVIESKYPLASQVLREDFYMDDLLSGTDSTDVAIQLYVQLNQATIEAGLPLRKWASNDPAVLEIIPAEQRELLVPLHIDNAQSIPTLGLQWTPVTDVLSFVLTSPRSREAVTKRTILSDTAKVFDPLGLLSPVIIRAKILLQEMWQIKASWDEELPSTLVNKWQAFREDLTSIENLRIQRYISQSNSTNSSLHGFCDASEKAYAAAVYLKTINDVGLVSV